MSENLDLVRSIYADWERGDFSSVEWADPEILYEIADGPAPGKWTGLAGMAEGSRSFLTAWDDVRVLPKQYRELDDEHVFVIIGGRGSGKTSGLEYGPISPGSANLWQIRAGRVTGLVFYWGAGRALADLGLEDG